MVFLSICSSNLCHAIIMSNIATHIKEKAVFAEPIIWTGELPNNAVESDLLWEALSVFDKNGVEAGYLAIEQFVSNNPESGWTPSLRDNLAQHYSSQGRFSKAIENWKLAWERTFNSDDKDATRIANNVLVKWGRLMSQLGMVEQLDILRKQAEGRVLDGDYLQRQWIGICDYLVMLKLNSGLASRCGASSLIIIARTLKLTLEENKIINEIAPGKGFTLKQLCDLSDKYNIGLVAAKWNYEIPLPMPCITHLKYNHYITLIDKCDGGYLVVDGMYSKPHWVSSKIIKEEASGYIMIVAGDKSSKWTDVEVAQANIIRGGYYQYDSNYMDNSEDTPQYIECDNGCSGDDEEDDADCDCK